jgi:hypothetical protein
MFIVLVLILLIAVTTAGVFVAVYRAEGLLAFYIAGTAMVLFVFETIRVPWSPVMTGLIRPLVFIPLVTWWWVGGIRRDELQLPRHVSFSGVLLLLLFVLWEAKYAYEGQYMGVESKYETLKWAYFIQNWGAALILGMMFPLTLKRLQRFLGAMGAMGIIWAVLEVGAFLMGRRDMRMEGSVGRYQFAASVGSLRLGIGSAMGGSCLLGWLLLKNRIQRSQKRNIFVGVSLGVIAIAVLLTGSRGPMVSLFATIVAFLLLLGGRNSMRFGLALIVLGVLVYAGYTIIPEKTRYRLFGLLFGEHGVAERAEIFLSALNILKVAPFLGQTRGITSLIGMENPHQLFGQILMETGLIGLGVYLICVIPAAIKWGVAAFRRQRTVWLFAAPLGAWFAFEFVQRNMAAGQLGSTDFWVIMGILLGHRLVPMGPAIDPYAEQDALAGLGSPEYGQPAPYGTL